ncbi:hypothetical protein WCLP8_3600016 [uncultured Gammaproteobacteria bacterium]
MSQFSQMAGRANQQPFIFIGRISGRIGIGFVLAAQTIGHECVPRKSRCRLVANKLGVQGPLGSWWVLVAGGDFYA